MNNATTRTDPFIPRWTQLSLAINAKELNQARLWFDQSTWEEVWTLVSVDRWFCEGSLVLASRHGD